MRKPNSVIGLSIVFAMILLFSNNAESLTITSSTFKYYANIPTPQACPYYGGTNSNPQLTLSDIPSATQAFVLIMDDPDSPGGTFLHWLMYWNSPNITSMNENSLPVGAVQGTNDSSTASYFGPCPPSDHRYYFRVYALDKTLSLNAGFTRSQLESAMAGHVLESNNLMGWFPGGGTSCTYTLSPLSQTLSNSATTGKITVSCSSSDCAWTATSNHSWLTITTGSSGKGSGTVNFSMTANSAAARTGTISIAGQTVSVTQAGVPTPTPTPTPCAATINSNLGLHIPYLADNNDALLLSADFVYEFNSVYPALVLFKLTNAAVVQKPEYTCDAATLSDNLKIHIPDVLLPGGTTRMWLDMEYSPVISTGGNAYFIVINYEIKDMAF